MNKKQYFGIIILAVLILGGLFYWLEWRPASVREYCSNWATTFTNTSLNNGGITRSQYQDKRTFNYNTCLNDKGLKD